MPSTVLINLLANAVKFSEPGGRLGVILSSDHARVTVTVWDNGCGIPEDQLDRVFRRFEQADHSDKASGTGLGLAISREIIDLHHGRIWAEPNPEGGSKLCFSVPIRQPAEAVSSTLG